MKLWVTDQKDWIPGLYQIHWTTLRHNKCFVSERELILQQNSTQTL